MFAILFVGLDKANAEEIIGRLAEDIRKNAGPQLRPRASIGYGHETWPAGASADVNALNRVLKKFGKKM